jgi:hypothetical protein
MSKITAILNLNDKKWSTQITKDDSFNCELEIGFQKGLEFPIIFNNLRFAVEIIQNEQLLEIRRYPPAGHYVNSENTILVSTQFSTTPDTDYKIIIKSAEEDDTNNTEINFTSPRPACPYPSWQWIDNYWQPPIPWPETIDDNNPPQWNESTQSWDLVT